MFGSCSSTHSRFIPDSGWKLERELGRRVGDGSGSGRPVSSSCSSLQTWSKNKSAIYISDFSHNCNFISQFGLLSRNSEFTFHNSVFCFCHKIKRKKGHCDFLSQFFSHNCKCTTHNLDFFCNFRNSEFKLELKVKKVTNFISIMNFSCDCECISQFFFLAIVDLYLTILTFFLRTARKKNCIYLFFVCCAKTSFHTYSII